jgi:hypothetical protein
MTTKDLLPGDWISIVWIACSLYVVKNDEEFLTVSSPSWRVNDTMKFKHCRFDYLNGSCWEYLGKSKANPLYNPITKLTGFVHPVTPLKH